MKLRGHVMMAENPLAEVAAALPHKPTRQQDLFRVATVGRFTTDQQARATRSVMVRRSVLSALLHTLKNYNPAYRELLIDEDEIMNLPDDGKFGTPESVLAGTVRHLDCSTPADEASYSSSSSHLVESASTTQNGEFSAVGGKRGPVVTQNDVHEDDQDELLTDELEDDPTRHPVQFALAGGDGSKTAVEWIIGSAARLEATNETELEKAIDTLVARYGNLVSDLSRDAIVKCYPLLFPFGRGGPTDPSIRKGSLSFESWCKRFFSLHDQSAAQLGLQNLLALRLYNIQSRRKAMRSAYVSLSQKKNDYGGTAGARRVPDTASTVRELHAALALAAQQKELARKGKGHSLLGARPDGVRESVWSLLRSVDASSAHLEHSDGAASKSHARAPKSGRKLILGQRTRKSSTTSLKTLGVAKSNTAVVATPAASSNTSESTSPPSTPPRVSANAPTDVACEDNRDMDQLVEEDAEEIISLSRMKRRRLRHASNPLIDCEAKVQGDDMIDDADEADDNDDDNDDDDDDDDNNTAGDTSYDIKDHGDDADARDIGVDVARVVATACTAKQPHSDIDCFCTPAARCYKRVHNYKFAVDTDGGAIGYYSNVVDARFGEHILSQGSLHANATLADSMPGPILRVTDAFTGNATVRVAYRAEYSNVPLTIVGALDAFGNPAIMTHSDTRAWLTDSRFDLSSVAVGDIIACKLFRVSLCEATGVYTMHGSSATSQIVTTFDLPANIGTETLPDWDEYPLVSYRAIVNAAERVRSSFVPLATVPTVSEAHQAAVDSTTATSQLQTVTLPAAPSPPPPVSTSYIAPNAQSAPSSRSVAATATSSTIPVPKSDKVYGNISVLMESGFPNGRSVAIAANVIDPRGARNGNPSVLILSITDNATGTIGANVFLSATGIKVNDIMETALAAKSVYIPKAFVDSYNGSFRLRISPSTAVELRACFSERDIDNDATGADGCFATPDVIFRPSNESLPPKPVYS